MEATFEPSVSTLRAKINAIRTKMAAIEAVELSSIGFLFWGLLMMIPTDPPATISVAVVLLIVVEGALLGSWGIYLAYIRLTRGMYSRLDIRLRFAIAALTGLYTFWAWIILDINRWIMAKLVYRGEAPVEYLWSAKSKLARKEWETAQKAKNVYLSA